MDSDGTNKIESLVLKIREEARAKHDWHPTYDELVKALFNLETVWIALSREKYNPEKHESEPLISTKDFNGAPSLYVFSTKEKAIEWAKWYNAVTPDSKYYYMGKIDKEPLDFGSLYQIAAYVGAKWVLLDEGGAYMGIVIGDIFAANGIDPRSIKMPVSVEDIDRVKSDPSTQFSLKFAPVKVLPIDEA